MSRILHEQKTESDAVSAQCFAAFLRCFMIFIHLLLRQKTNVKNYSNHALYILQFSGFMFSCLVEFVPDEHALTLASEMGSKSSSKIYCI